MTEPIVLISAIEHYVYCQRQCALIHGDGVWNDNPHTIRGHRIHRRVDSPAQSRMERGHLVLRAVPLWSETYGLSGRSDALEFHSDDRIVPIEYKAGNPHGKTAELQLCAQALCLEEMLQLSVTEGFVWYSAQRKRHRVTFDLDIRLETLEVIECIRTQLVSGKLPSAPNDSRCHECQLWHHCLPTVVANSGYLKTYLRDIVWQA